MINVRLLFLLSVTLVVSACTGFSGSSKYMKPVDEFLSPDEGKALVRFLRPGKHSGSVRSFFILDGEQAIGSLPNKSQFDYLADPGKHIFLSMAEGFEPYFLEAELEPGKTYYVIAKLVAGWRVRAFLIPATQSPKDRDNIEYYEKNYKQLKPDTMLLKAWEKSNTVEIQKNVNDYKTLWKPEYEWGKLNKEDGR